jgi:hypothetical protein
MVKYCYNLWAWTAFFSLPIRSCHIITDSLTSTEVKWNVVLHRELAYIRCFGKVVGCSKCHQTYSSFIVSIPQIKGKAVPQHTYRGARGERRYSSYSFTISALDGGERSASRPGRTLPPGKVPLVPIEQETGWAPEPVWTQVRGKILLPLLGIKPRSPSPVCSQTLYWLSYPGSQSHRCLIKILNFVHFN